MDKNLQDLELPAEDSDEEIIFAKKKHPGTLNVSILKALGLFLLLLIFYSFIGANIYFLIIFIILAVLIFYILYKAFFIYNNDLYVLTNRRIIDIDQLGFFNRSVTEVNLDKVQHTKYQTKGLAATIFNYGDVLVETAGGDKALILEKIKDPYSVQQEVIFQVKNNSAKSKQATSKSKSSKSEFVLR